MFHLRKLLYCWASWAACGVFGECGQEWEAAGRKVGSLQNRNKNWSTGEGREVSRECWDYPTRATGVVLGRHGGGPKGRWDGVLSGRFPWLPYALNPALTGTDEFFVFKNNASSQKKTENTPCVCNL